MRQGRESLLERDRASATCDAALTRAREGTGSVLIAAGPAGIGKSALLTQASAAAAADGVTVLRATCAELETGLSFGAARQLFEPVLADAGERDRLLCGDAVLARPVLDATADIRVPDAEMAVCQGLHALVRNLTRDGALLITIDDAHWIDEPTQRWLEFMLRRLEPLPVFVLLAARPATSGAAPLAGIAAAPVTDRITLAPLSRDASASLAQAQFGGDVDEAFATACHQATGGNPFLLTELHTALAERGIAPVAGSVPKLFAVGSREVAELIVARVQRLGEAALKLATAAAVLDAGFRIADAGTLAELDDETWAQAADALIVEGILADPPRRFRHPVIRASLYDTIPPVARGRLHGKAARLLARRAGTEDEVAAHLLHVPEQDDEWVVDQLIAAAGLARRRGAPTVSARLLKRALIEPPERPRVAAVLAALGEAELQFDPAEGRAHLAEALRGSREPRARSRIAIPLGTALLLDTDTSAAFAVAESAIDGLGGEDREASLMLEAVAMLAAACGVAVAGRGVARAMQLGGELKGRTAGERAALGQVAFYASCAGLDPAQVRALSVRALSRTPDETLDPVAASSPAMALVQADLLGDADAALADLLDHSRRLGSVMWESMVFALRAELRHRQGRLSDALEDAERALAPASRTPAPAWESIALAAMMRALADRGEAERALRIHAGSSLPERLVDTAWGAIVDHALGSAALTYGDVTRATAALGRAGAVMRRLGMRSPAPIGWRADAARAAASAGDGERAMAIADRNLELARACGAARTLGIALRTRAFLAQPLDLAMLRESLTVLEASGATLERMRTEAALGAALRRAGERREAIAVLTGAVRGAEQVGAAQIRAWCRDELHVLRGAGAESGGALELTAAERRIAELAASGLSNKAIAQTVHITVNTVQTHLSRTYGKLGIRSRDELAASLGELPGAEDH